MKLTHAMILAAGLGTRMRPLTETTPKPLIAVAGKPLIDWCLEFVKGAGIRTVVINSSYLPEQLEAHVAPYPQVRVSREDFPPLETGGGIKKALPMLGTGPFLTLNSDAIFPLPHPHPLQPLMQAWTEDLDFLMLLVPKARCVGWQGRGDFVVDAAGRIRRPRDGEDAPYVFTGVEIIHPRVFTDCQEGAFSLSLLWRRLEEADGWHRRMRAVIYEGPWLNVGDLAGLAAAHAWLAGNPLSE